MLRVDGCRCLSRKIRCVEPCVSGSCAGFGRLNRLGEVTMLRSRVTPALLLSVLLASLAGLAAAAEPIGPDPALAPEEVVAIQLNALKNNDDPTPNAGIAQTYALAHPDNKRATGPLPRFEQMIRGPAYSLLLGHAAHRIERLAGDDTTVRFRVVVETSDGDAVQYLWEVRRVGEGPHAGAWLTTAVSAPIPAGQAL
jgi:hypothetical protein